MMNKIISATRTIPGFVLTVVAGMLYVSAVTAAPVTVDFTKNDASGSGSLSGAGPNVSRYFVCDSDDAKGRLLVSD